MNQIPEPTLEVGEKKIEVAGLVLIYDINEKLIYTKCLNGNPFSVTGNALRLLELLGYEPETIYSDEQIICHLYDSLGKPRPTQAFASVFGNISRGLREEFKKKTGSDQIISHRGKGHSLPLYAKRPSPE